ncbi:DNA-binding transcriptional regulator GadX [compost metagenome]
MDYRIQQSLLLLQRPENNVTDVAYQVGFNSTSYFIYQFGKAMNMTPLAYRKQKIGVMDTGQH